MTPAPRSRDNNFDLLRLAAATAVLVSHCYALTAAEDPLADLSGGHTFGELGVSIFFGISGFLVARSWIADPRPGAFAQRRALRLLPALALVAALTAFVLGPSVSRLSVGDYLGDADPYVYALRTSLLVTFDGTLPGVFTSNPYPDAVNGSLWTLPVEALAYVLVLVLGLLGLVSRRGWPLLLAGLGTAALLASSSSPIDVSSLLAVERATGAGIPQALRLVAIFIGAMLLALAADRVPLRWLGLGAAVAAWWLLRETALEPFVAALAVPYGVLCLAYLRRLRVPIYERGGDASYGMYVYAFPVQQTVAHLIDDVSPGAMLAIALPVTFVLGRLSWRLVEQPALRRKPTRPPRPAQ